MKRRIAAKTGRTAAQQREAYLPGLPRLAARVVSAVVLAGALVAGDAAAQSKPESPDAAITLQVEVLFSRDPFLGAMRIEVKTSAGVVSLSGYVRSLEDVVKAGELARGVPGVSAVRNGLRVADRPSRA